MSKEVQDKLNAVGMDKICERTADCVPMRTIAKDIGVDWSTLVAYINATPERIQQYARAREAQADKFAEEILAIADDGTNDTYTDANGLVRTDQEVIGRSRLRVDSRKWLASKMFPKRYGDKVTSEHTGEGGGPVKIDIAERPRLSREEWLKTLDNPMTNDSTRPANE